MIPAFDLSDMHPLVRNVNLLNTVLKPWHKPFSPCPLIVLILAFSCLMFISPWVRCGLDGTVVGLSAVSPYPLPPPPMSSSCYFYMCLCGSCMGGHITKMAVFLQVTLCPVTCSRIDNRETKAEGRGYNHPSMYSSGCLSSVSTGRYVASHCYFFHVIPSECQALEEVQINKYECIFLHKIGAICWSHKGGCQWFSMCIVHVEQALSHQQSCSQNTNAVKASGFR